MSRPPRQLTPGEAQRSLANRLSRVVDRARQIDARLGNRPYNVYLCWTKWNGDERGEGSQELVCRIPLTPTPIVDDLTSVSLSSFGAGILPVGSFRIREVSSRYSFMLLTGRVLPEKEDQVPHPYDFFYEVVEDGRHQQCEGKPTRPRYRLFATPYLDAKNQQWILVLERTSGEMAQDGKPLAAPVVPPVNPWADNAIVPPPDDD